MLTINVVLCVDVTTEESAALPELSWTFACGDLHGIARSNEEDPAGVCAQWAAVLGLVPAERLSPGTVAYEGPHESVGIRVWGITDRAAWKAATAESMAKWAAQRQEAEQHTDSEGGQS